MDHDDFMRNVLGNHVVIGRINTAPCNGMTDDLVCRYGDLWFYIDADYEGHWSPVSESEALAAIAKFSV